MQTIPFGGTGDEKPVPDIELTDAESALFGAVIFDWEAADYEANRRSSDAVVALMTSLLARQGIPAVRWKYFIDPDYRTGRMKGSRRDLFHRNRNTDDEMMRSVSFLQHLRYFVCGPDLPADALHRFREQVEHCSGHFDSEDVIPLGKFARAETRAHRLPPHEACEEYFKLALDCGIWVSHALRIRDFVKTIR